MYRCFLRVRTSPGFRVARAYGALQPDEDHAGLYTIVGAPATTAVALDFELDSEGFRDVATAYGEAERAWLCAVCVLTKRGPWRT
jgi:hypothetical protein